MRQIKWRECWTTKFLLVLFYFSCTSSSNPIRKYFGCRIIAFIETVSVPYIISLHLIYNLLSIKCFYFHRGALTFYHHKHWRQVPSMHSLLLLRKMKPVIMCPYSSCLITYHQSLLIRLSILKSPLFPKKQAPEVTTFNSNYTVSVSLKSLCTIGTKEQHNFVIFPFSSSSEFFFFPTYA